MMKELYIHDENDMLLFGAGLQKACFEQQKVIIYLIGDLGAGKTTLARGFLQAAGYEGTVKSPTYTLVESYTVTSHKIFHFDLYRLADPEELEYIGIRDYFSGAYICLIEWPERGAGILPGPDISCYIRAQDNGRMINLEAHNEVGQQIIASINT